MANWRNRTGLVPLMLGLLFAGCSSPNPLGHSFSARPVLCYAPAYAPPTTVSHSAALPTCGTSYRLTASNLSVSTSTEQPTASIGADPVFAHVPSTPASMVESTNTVLLPGAIGAGPTSRTRLVLGPAQLTKTDIQHASADDLYGQWLVNVTLTPAGTKAWDHLTQMQFHSYIAFVDNGVVISAPLIQPSQTAFSSFGGRMQIAGNFTQQFAQALVADLQS